MKTQKSWLLLFGVLLCLYFPQVLAQTTNSQLTEEVTKNESGTKSTENPPNVEKTTAVGNHSELLGENSHSENNLAENTDAAQFGSQTVQYWFRAACVADLQYGNWKRRLISRGHPHAI